MHTHIGTLKKLNIFLKIVAISELMISIKQNNWSETGELFFGSNIPNCTGTACPSTTDERAQIMFHTAVTCIMVS